MKKIVCGVLAILLLFSIALAESVTQMNYELTIDDQTRIGKYTGNIENGVPDGYGIFVTTNPNGFSWHYIGDWQDGVMHGEGATYWEDGSLEIGSYEYGHFVFGYCSYDGADLMLYTAESLDRSIITEEAEAEPTEPVVQFIGNKNSKVFHRLTCDSVREMKDKNKVEFYTREEALELHYKPCQRCNP